MRRHALICYDIEEQQCGYESLVLDLAFGHVEDGMFAEEICLRFILPYRQGDAQHLFFADRPGGETGIVRILFPQLLVDARIYLYVLQDMLCISLLCNLLWRIKKPLRKKDRLQFLSVYLICGDFMLYLLHGFQIVDIIKILDDVVKEIRHFFLCEVSCEFRETSVVIYRKLFEIQFVFFRHFQSPDIMAWRHSHYAVVLRDIHRLFSYDGNGFVDDGDDHFLAYEFFVPPVFGVHRKRNIAENGLRCHRLYEQGDVFGIHEIFDGVQFAFGLFPRDLVLRDVRLPAIASVIDCRILSDPSFLYAKIHKIPDFARHERCDEILNMISIKSHADLYHIFDPFLFLFLKLFDPLGHGVLGRGSCLVAFLIAKTGVPLHLFA